MRFPKLHPWEWKQVCYMGISGSFLLAILWFVLSLLFGGCATEAADPPGKPVPNLSEVAPGIWRGAQPRTLEAWLYLRRLGLTNDIKLNTGDESSDRAAVSAGFRLYYFPIDTMEQLVEGPDPGMMKEVVDHMQPGTFVHCEHGQDRTGLAVGLFRLKQGTNAAAAWQEMTNHGYHPALMGLTRFWKRQVEAGSR